jgi:hypothetical protein
VAAMTRGMGMGVSEGTSPELDREASLKSPAFRRRRCRSSRRTQVVRLLRHLRHLQQP